MVTLAEIPGRLSDDTRDGRLYAYIGTMLAVDARRDRPRSEQHPYRTAMRQAWDSLSRAEQDTIAHAQHLTWQAIQDKASE